MTAGEFRNDDFLCPQVGNALLIFAIQSTDPSPVHWLVHRAVKLGRITCQTLRNPFLTLGYDIEKKIQNKN